jgi:anti-sigma factor RsiW
VNCTAVREALPEFALGVAPQDDTSTIELHVETCAACRKEAIDLQRAAAAFAYALAPSEDPEPELEDRVVDSVRRLARPWSRSRGRGRRSGVVLLAAAIVVASIGVGSVIAGREAQKAAQAERDALSQVQQLQRFGVTVSDLDPSTKVFTGLLAARTGAGTGAALTLVSPAVEDRLVVIVNDVGDRSLPLSISVSDTKGHRFNVGEIPRLDTAGGATFADIVGSPLDGFLDVAVRDAKGHIVLRGTLEAETTVASPTP